MINKEEAKEAKARTAEIFRQIGIVLTVVEVEKIEIADFGLGNLMREGLEIVTYVNNDRYCAKELVLFPRQTCPEHKHPPVGVDPGKMETFRCRSGEVYLYVQGKAVTPIHASVPEESKSYYTVFHQVKLMPGDQFTIPPGVLHWFQGGDNGAVVSEFSSASRDEFDIFTDPRIVRLP